MSLTNNQEKMINIFLYKPDRSIKEISSDLGVSRQAIWKMKKRCEEKNIIWGNSSVVNEIDLGFTSSYLNIKLKEYEPEIAIKKIEISAKNNYIQIVNLHIIANETWDIILQLRSNNINNIKRFLLSLEDILDNNINKKEINHIATHIIRECHINPKWR